MNIDTTAIQQGAGQGQAGQAQGAKGSGANDPLAALFADFLGLADALVGAGTDSGKAKKTDDATTLPQGAQMAALAGTPFLPLPVAAQTAAAAQNGVAAPNPEAPKTAAPANATTVAVAVQGTALAAAAQGKAAADAATDAATTPAGDPKPEATAAEPTKADQQAQPQTALPPLTINLAPSVTLAAPKTVAPVGAEKAKPAASAGGSSKSTTPVSVTVEKAEPASAKAEEAPQQAPPTAPVAASAAAAAKDEPATAPAKPELTVTAASGLAPAAAPAPIAPDKPVQPQAVAVPLHPATEQVVHRVEKALEKGEDRIRIELKPASLGGVEVHLHIADDGRVSAMVRADRADTLALLQNDVRGLEQALKDAGLRPDAGSLTFNLRQGEGQAGHQPDARGQRRRGNGERAAFSIEGVGADAPAARDLLAGLDIRI